MTGRQEMTVSTHSMSPALRSAKRCLGNTGGRLVFLWALTGALAHLYSIFIAFWTPQVHMAMHLFFALSLSFILYKPRATASDGGPDPVPWYDLVLSAMSLLATAYIMYDWQGILRRVARPNRLDIVFAVLTMLLILEGTRRVMGLVLPCIALVFTAYAFFGYLLPDVIAYRGARLARFASIQYMTTEGIWSSPTQVSAKMIFMFTLFGSFLLVSGAGDKLMDIAMAFAGQYTGGPGKVAVVSSGLMGMISGSASANVATTGQFTIPMMKRLGFSPHMAGAVEAVASTGGTLAPPVMGAGAFIMAEMLGVSYLTIVKAAVIPAVIYYLSAFGVVHFESRRLNLRGLPREELPDRFTALKQGLLVIIPVTLLLYLVFTYYPLMKSALAAIVALTSLSWLSSNRMTPAKICRALADGMTGMITLALCCASAGIVVGCVALTGLGPKFASGLVAIAGSTQWLALIIAMAVTIILGMGLPATAAYVVAASVAAPALLRMDFDPLGTQMYIFYFSCLAQITPPIALASYVGAAIAGANPLRTAVTSMRLGLVSLVIPFMFIVSPTLLMQGEPVDIIWDCLVAMAGVTICSIGLVGYFRTGMGLAWRLACIAAGLLLIQPGIWTDTAGGLLFITALGANAARRRKTALVVNADAG